MIDSFENLPRPRTDIYSKLGMSVHPVVCCPEEADKYKYCRIHYPGEYYEYGFSYKMETLPPKVNIQFTFI